MWSFDVDFRNSVRAWGAGGHQISKTKQLAINLEVRLTVYPQNIRPPSELENEVDFVVCWIFWLGLKSFSIAQKPQGLFHVILAVEGCAVCLCCFFP
mmetsp:Transcript_8625/g.18580  ORF Transcript_8625/g.18580 Transcript_8625/m.18580 type:complete len:97 (-) Transcript_8625:120-410(-)